MFSWSELHIQRWFDPVVIDNHILVIVLRIPGIIIRMISNLNIVIPQQFPDDQSHLHIRQTDYC
jgi:hypothetical protein